MLIAHQIAGQKFFDSIRKPAQPKYNRATTAKNLAALCRGASISLAEQNNPAADLPRRYSMTRAPKTLFVVLASAVMLTAGIQKAFAQPAKASALPSTINLVIPYIPGTGADIQTRVVARYLPKHLPGSPVFVVKNDAGAGGRAGVQTVYRSKPDGSSIGGAYTPDALGNEALYGIDGAGFDFSKFVPLMSTYHQPYTVSVGPKAPYKSLDEMKRSGKPVPFCTTTGMDMSYIVIATKAIGIPMRLIPGFKGAPTAMAGLLRGDCDAVSLGIEFTNRYLKDGVRPIAVYGAERQSLWPDVPTAKEQGYPLELEISLSYFMPPATSNELANLFRDGLAKLYRDPEFLEAIKTAGFTPTYADGKRTQQIVSSLSALFSKYAHDLRDAAAKTQ
jgi:tripartite-type tricarboxylate transporter receptor subunit TctC